MDLTFQRRVRWAMRGALTLALLGIFFGTMFMVLITLAVGVPEGAGAGFWLRLLLLNALLWGVGALPFGAVLGMFASMIWRDEHALHDPRTKGAPDRSG
jgi:hypothetical protein